MRANRIIWLAWRDLRIVLSGKSWWKLPVVALVLLLPAGTLTFETPDVGQRTPKVAGTVPPELEGRVVQAPRALVRLSVDEGVIVHGNRVPPVLRRVLDDALGGPTIEVRDLAAERRLPGRSLLVALLALSLLTGPLTESTAGERRRRTLDALMSAGISRVELVTGKWLAWTGVASLTCLGVAVAGLISGSQEPGVWPIGLPLVAGTAVAFALWLQRHADDEVGAAARTMRVVPVAAMLAGGAALALAGVHPVLGAAVPLGGPLLLAGDLLVEPTSALAATASTLVWVALLLAHTARSLDRVLLRQATPWGFVFAAVLVWWLPVGGPEVWAAAGNPELTAQLSRPWGLATAAGLLGSLAAVVALRGHLSVRWRTSVTGAAVAFAVGLVLSAAHAPGAGLYGRADAALASATVVGALAVVAQEGFRAVLARNAGPVLAGLAWVLVCSPHRPFLGAVAAVALGALNHRFGLLAAVVAHLVWAFSPL